MVPCEWLKEFPMTPTLLSYCFSSIDFSLFLTVRSVLVAPRREHGLLSSARALFMWKIVCGHIVSIKFLCLFHSSTRSMEEARLIRLNDTTGRGTATGMTEKSMKKTMHFIVDRHRTCAQPPDLGFFHSHNPPRNDRGQNLCENRYSNMHRRH